MKPPSSIKRKDLLTAFLGRVTVSEVVVQEITLGPGMMGGLHLHACPVTGYIVQGTAILQIEGQQEQVLPQGTAFYEPKKVRITRFGNFSQTECLVFVAFYLRKGQEALLTMLE